LQCFVLMRSILLSAGMPQHVRNFIHMNAVLT
jgi:hypothetical protein